MHKVPAIAFSAWSGTGKTTLVEKLIIELKSRGLRIAAIKHDAHRFEIDREGKDSWRFTNAGADVTIVSSPEKTAIIELGERSLADNLSMLHDVDLALVEGWKNEQLPRIGICRKATGLGLPAAAESYIAVVSDGELENCPVPVFGLEDIKDLADFILAETKVLDKAGTCGTI